MISVLHIARRACQLARIPNAQTSRRVHSAAMHLKPLEEELLPYFSARDFYSVQPGQVFNKRYQTVVKLGFGGGSTVWLETSICKSTYLVTIDLLK